MEKLVIKGGRQLKGEVSVSGSKNEALKALVAACLTDKKVIVENIPLISDFFLMAEIIEELGGKVVIKGHTAEIQIAKFKGSKISLEKAAQIRTSSMFLAPLLARTGKAMVPNPGGCRIGARPIDRVVTGLRKMGVLLAYDSTDGYFHAEIKNNSGETSRLKGTRYRFEKNTHTGTETLMLAAVLADGKTVLENAAEEPEIDELISFLNKMGAKIKRVKPRMIEIEGVPSLNGARFSITPDRNEIVTFAIAAIITGGDVLIKNADSEKLTDFLDKLRIVGGGFAEQKNGIRFYANGELSPTDILTLPYPGFMTDWQGPFAVLMTKAKGTSVIHETVYENRFGYVSELKKMGANIKLFNPVIKNPKAFYNFNQSDDSKKYRHAAKIKGPVNLHNGVLEISDLRAGATLVLGALAAKGTSVIFGVEHLDRGYEQFESRLASLGADIKRITDDSTI